MGEANAAAAVGYVLLALATLAALAVALRQLLGKERAANGGAHDVTRREFEQEKSYAHDAIHEVRTLLQSINTRLAVIEYRLGGEEKGGRA